MTNKTTTANRTKKQAKVVHPGMIGDGTEEQNLGQRGNPSARIKKKEVARRLRQATPHKKIALVSITGLPLRALIRKSQRRRVHARRDLSPSKFC